MARLGETYRGLRMSLWRRLALRYSGLSAVLLGILWGCLFLVSVLSGLHPDRAMLLILVLAFPLSLVAIWATSERRRLVREAPLPRFLKQKLVDAYPHLTLRDAELVERGLRQFFTACQRSNKRFVAMPSQVVDSMWHEFILHTSAYREWCDLVIGRFVDHVPAEVLGRKASTNDGLRRTWFWACREESINPKKPSRLPLLFALDAKFAIAGGFVYLADCKGVRRDDGAGGSAGAYCGESFSDGSYSGDADGFGGSESSGGGSDGDGGSGSGCGSGCGGGGD
ncbi:hypothetical protein [Polaromonas sp. A23]|uniref:glycine-rich domain-containing protein n=1 Tax=Polaromonas sp. A23 TaxID=1944133 RepID=UPI00098710D7|nr:hypothetical protein [Polaromonas sp. A23]OOG36647.1 hypothetical protein B0B52_20310 [Polaromonas sp. A23]